MSSFPLTNSIIFQDGEIAPPTCQLVSILYIYHIIYIYMSNISQIQDAEGPGTSQGQGVGVFRCVASWPRFSVWPPKTMEISDSTNTSTLWLCQNSYWKWPLIVDFPIQNGGYFHSYVNVYQRVEWLPTIPLWIGKKRTWKVWPPATKILSSKPCDDTTNVTRIRANFTKNYHELPPAL
jgi:hypothetical protein